MLKPLSEMTPEERAYAESWLSEQEDDGKEERPRAVDRRVGTPFRPPR